MSVWIWILFLAYCHMVGVGFEINVVLTLVTSSKTAYLHMLIDIFSLHQKFTGIAVDFKFSAKIFVVIVNGFKVVFFAVNTPGM